MRDAHPDIVAMLALPTARLAAQGDHSRWEGDNHAACPICHARARLEAAGLAQPRPAISLTGWSIEVEEENLYAVVTAERVVALRV